MVHGNGKMVELAGNHGFLEKRQSYWLGRIFGTVLFAGVSFAAMADEGAAFPILNSEAFCTALVSKMLNADEKRVEHDKCLVDERQFKLASEQFWYLVPPKTQSMIVRTYFKEERFQTYGTVFKYVSFYFPHRNDKPGK